MLPAHADPVLLEALGIATELKATKRALMLDCARLFGEETQHRLRHTLQNGLGESSQPDHEQEHPDGHDHERRDGHEHERRDGHGQQNSAIRDRNAFESFPGVLRPALASFFELRKRLQTLLDNERHRELIDDALTERAKTLRLAIQIEHSDAQRAAEQSAARQIVAQAVASGRDVTAAEDQEVHRLHVTAGEPSTHATAWEQGIDSADTRDRVLSVLATMRVKAARLQLRNGLLLTPQMRDIISESLPALHRGDPVMFIGETGGAKTALAEYLSRRELERDPEFVSGYGDITSAQVIGSHELRAESGATITEFVYGPLLRAMTNGAPLILDEINAMPPEFLKRLNRILQLRPGDTFAVQENAGRPVIIEPGFAILATANEQTPHRYRGLDRLSAELVNRFGANTYRVKYPDFGASYTDTPSENMLLATAAVADRNGDLPRHLSGHHIERIARAAFISQQVFAGTHGEGFDEFISTEREIDGRPGLEESVLAPRTLVAILQKVAGSAGSVSLDQAVRRFLEGTMHREDRRVLTLIAQGQGFVTGSAGSQA